MQDQSDSNMQVSLDNEEYNEAELITIKVPLSVPYQQDRTDFERVDGEINYQGTIYKYVKRRMFDGELVLLCLPDKNKMMIQSAKDNFFKFANDLVQNNSKKSDHSKQQVSKNSFSDYISNQPWFNNLLQIKLLTLCVIEQATNFPTTPYSSPGQPPDIC